MRKWETKKPENPQKATKNGLHAVQMRILFKKEEF